MIAMATSTPRQCRYCVFWEHDMFQCGCNEEGTPAEEPWARRPARANAADSRRLIRTDQTRTRSELSLGVSGNRGELLVRGI